MNKTKRLAVASMMAAFTCIATMVIKISTPTMGYIHLGDGLVLLCGIVLGPVTGGLAAGIGSCFADIFSGYITWAPGTFLIKFVCAALAGFIFRKLRHVKQGAGFRYACVAIGGIVAEIWMVIAYFLYEILLVEVSMSFSGSLSAAVAGSATGIPFNAVQGLAGIIIAVVLTPILLKIEELRHWILD